MIASIGRPLRVTFYSDAEYFGGAEGYLTLLARHLNHRAFALDLVLPPRPGARILEERMRTLGVRIHHQERLGLAWPSRLGAMVRFLRTLGGDVFHLNLPSCYDGGVSSVAWAARRAGYPRVVSTEHLPMVDRKYRQFPVKIFFSQWIDSVIVNTRSNRALLVRRHGIDSGRVSVVDNGAEDSPAMEADECRRQRQEWGATDESVVLGIVGRLTRRKGHHFLFEALEILQQTPALPPWILVVVGEGEEGERLHRQGAELERSGRLHWLGHCEDAPRLMRAFDLLVLPSTVETMPFAIIEGMAASLPVVASAIYGIPELVVHGETGYLVPPAGVGALASRLKSLLLDPPTRAAMGAAGRRRFEERFTAARMADRTARIYRGEDLPALGNGRPGGLPRERRG